MMDTTAALSTGYRITDLQDSPNLARETPAYTATLTHEGSTVATITSDGGGGAPLLRFTDHTHEHAFTQAAQEFTQRLGDPTGLPPVEELVMTLYLYAAGVAALTEEATRSVLVQYPTDAPWWDGGSYRTVAGFDEAAVREALRDARPGARVWDSREGRFTPA